MEKATIIIYSSASILFVIIIVIMITMLYAGLHKSMLHLYSFFGCFSLAHVLYFPNPNVNTHFVWNKAKEKKRAQIILMPIQLKSKLILKLVVLVCSAGEWWMDIIITKS